MSSLVQGKPGFAVDAIDVYETSDLPESDQHMYSNTNETTDSVETLSISANEAFGRFKGSYIDSSAVDFSDKLRKTKKKGYTIVWTGEDHKEERETPIKKYQRLNCEVRELLEEINASKNKESDTNMETIGAQLTLMHKQLLELRLEDVLDKDVIHMMTDPQAAARKKLMIQLEQMKTYDSVCKNKNTSNTPSYSLFLKQSTSALQEEALLSSLSSRLAALEVAVGFSADSMSTLTMETGKKNVIDAVQVLSSKTTLMDPAKLDHIEGRLGALQHKLGHLQESNQGLDEESSAKLNELMPIVEKSKVYYDSVPDTLTRMETLQNLHQQSAEFSQSVVELEAVQSQLAVEIGNDLSLLRSTKEKFANNMANIEKNFSSLFERIERLKN